MKKLQIITGERNLILRAVSLPVKVFDNALKKFVKAMEGVMLAANGLGIAAPQVGKNLRVFIVTLNYKTMKEVKVAMINPEILSFSQETAVAEEGCLSLPGQYGKVERPLGVKVAFTTIDGTKQMFALEGLNARVVQHECDHLEGVLFIDRVK